MKKIICFVFSFVVTGLAFAEVPVVDLSQTVAQNQQTQAQAASGKQVQPPASSQQAQPQLAPPAPIVQSIAEPVQQSLSLDQRVARLEQQMQNITQMNMPNKLDELQQQVQNLQGRLDVEEHDLKLLNKQLRDFYQDLNQRISQDKTLASADSAKSSSSAGVVSSPTSSNLFTKEQQDYEAAFTLLRNKKYDDAVSKLQAYLNNYPNGKYAGNAHYWLGEIYYLQSQLDQAVAEFQTVVDKYDSSAKAADSLLKLAMIHKAQGKKSQAQKEFQQVKTKYPESAAARLAQQQLVNIAKPSK